MVLTKAASREHDEHNSQRRRPGWKTIFFVIALPVLLLLSFWQLSSASASSSSSSSIFDVMNYNDMMESIIESGSGMMGGGGSKGQSSRGISFAAVHRKEVQDALDKLISQKTTTTTNTTTEYRSPEGTLKRIDLTKNYPRIQDYLMGTSSPVNRIIYSTDTNDQKESTTESKETEKDEPLNIVLFYADDWTMKVLGVLNEYVSTPNIDEMSRNGVTFTSNCVTTSICWISRNTLNTGVYAAVHRNVKISDMEMFNKTVQWPETLFPQLKGAGYYTGLVGKWHAPTPREFMSYTFDVMNIYYGRHWMVRDGKRRHVTDCNGEDAIKFLRGRPKDKRFALTVNFFATHAVDYTDPPYQPMKESMPLYANDTIPKPKTATEDHWKRLPWFFGPKNEGRKRWVDRFDTDENYQDKIKNLYRLASEVDSVVGTVIDELKRQGVYEKTFLMFTTDNGNLHGEHGTAEKWYPWEESIRVPLVIQDPRMPMGQRGTFNEEFTLSVDIAPTLLSAAKIPVPPHMQGRDMAPLYLQPEEAAKTWRQDFFYEWTQGRNEDGEGHGPLWHIPAVFALIRKDWKYFFWPQTGYEQLFHIEEDKYEEWDVLNSTMQTTKEALFFMKERYRFMKEWAQSGKPV